MKNIYKCDCNVIHEDIIDEARKRMLSNGELSKLVKFFKVIGDDTRIRILWALDNNEMCVCDIANLLGMTKSSVSHSLNILRKNKVVKFKRVGREVMYKLDDEHIKEVFEVGLTHIGEMK